MSGNTQLDGSDHPDARRFQKRLRSAIADFAKSQIGKGDDGMMLSGVMTECLAAIYKLLEIYGYAPTEDEFVSMFSRTASIIARGEHFTGVHKKGGNA
jgi:hypothetical protein